MISTLQSLNVVALDSWSSQSQHDLPETEPQQYLMQQQVAKVECGVGTTSKKVSCATSNVTATIKLSRTGRGRLPNRMPSPPLRRSYLHLSTFVLVYAR